MRSFIAGSLLAVSCFLLAGNVRAQTISAYISAPKEQGVPYKDVTTETFESLPIGQLTSDYAGAVGTYTLSKSAAYSVIDDNIYGSGTGKYVSFGAQSGTSDPITLTLKSPVAYFGFSWNAGDSNNGLSFYNGNTLLGSYSTSTIAKLFTDATVNSIDGTTYKTADYLGKPSGVDAGKNAAERYGFLSFIAKDTTFDRVVFSNNGTTGSGFETDNHTVRKAAPEALGSFVAVGKATGSAVPEPGTLGLLLPVAFGSLGMVRRRAGK